MSNTKKTVLIITVVLITGLLITGLLAESNNSQNEMIEIGKLHKEVIDSQDVVKNENVLIRVGSKNIYKSTIDTSMQTYKLMGHDLTEKEVQERLIRNYVIFLEAERNGFDVSDEDVDAYKASIKSAMKNDSMIEEEFLAYLSGVGITLDEYFILVDEEIRMMLAISRYRESITDKYIGDENKIEAWNIQVEKLMDNEKIIYQ